MNKMSARFVGKKVGLSTEKVYDMWKEMGLVFKGDNGNWLLTDLGQKIGGSMSSSGYVPTFEFETIEKMMIEFYNLIKKR